jgi:AraC-like DNA-binding protein
VLDYTEAPPPAPLTPYVECLWSVTGGDAIRTPQRIVPDACPELILHVGDPFERWDGARWTRQPRVFLAGTLTRPWLVRPGRKVATYGIRFRPGRLGDLFPVSMAAMADREVPPRELGLRPPRVGRTAPANRFEQLAAWLTALVPRKPRHSTAAPAVDAIRRSRGTTRIDDVAAELGWSRRRLERLFARDLGIAPKTYARIVRLQAVLARLDEAERAGMVDLALEAGYFDQPHLLREFRALAGRSPTVPRARDGELARHFTAPDRLRALLRGDDAFVQSGTRAQR